MRTLLFILLIASPAYAELQNCNGTWTNLPCKSSVTASLPEQSSITRSTKEAERSQKDLWLTDLDLHRIKAQRETKRLIDIFEARTVCKSESSTLLECRHAVDKKVREIEELESKFKILQTLPPPPTQAPERPSVTIIQNREIILPRSRHYGNATDGERHFESSGQGTIITESTRQGVSVSIGAAGYTSKTTLETSKQRSSSATEILQPNSQNSKLHSAPGILNTANLENKGILRSQSSEIASAEKKQSKSSSDKMQPR